MVMNIALLGQGKTGSKVLELHQEVTAFDTKNPPTLEKLKKHDVIISFLPAEAFTRLIPMLLASKKPVVTGSTGIIWTDDFKETLKKNNLKWIYASNFSLGVVAMKILIEKLRQMDHLFTEKKFSIHEIHHTKKLDSPSGTALSMEEWLKSPCQISSERMGDVIGLHTLTLETPDEIIRIEHEAKQRSLFAKGALWAAHYILENKLEPGFYSFQQIVEKHLSL
jgi:4-hydroxy-tetrahydrodipicolinate reductase